MEHLRHPSENPLFAVCVTVSMLIYLLVTVSLVGLIYAPFIMLGLLISHGLMIGHTKGNGVRVSATQFPDLHRRVEEYSRRLGLARAPDVYVLQQGGMLNAFATRFLGRDFVVLYSDVLELAYERGEEAVAFVVAHELGHIQRKHLNHRWLIYPALVVPFLGAAYQRACEYTCDRIGTYLAPEGAIPGLLVLAAGKALYSRVDAQAVINQVQDPAGFWVTFAELVATHPHLSNRLDAVASFQESAVRLDERIAREA